MNNNNKSRLNQGRRNKAKGEKSSVFDVPKTIEGGRTTYARVFNFQSMPRKSKNGMGKVARKGAKTKFEVEQADVLDAEVQEIKKIELQRVVQLNSPVV